MPTTIAYDTVHKLALEQHGVFTSEQAVALGLAPNTLVKMANRGRLERLAFGLYRDTGAPETQWTEYMAAVLWPRGVAAVLSHETALSLMELSDVNPSAIHVTVPSGHRVRRREPPAGVVLHHADLADEDVGSVEALPVTRAARTIRDCAAAKIGPALLRQAIADGLRGGWLTSHEAEALESEMTQGGKL